MKIFSKLKAIIIVLALLILTVILFTQCGSEESDSSVSNSTVSDDKKDSDIKSEPLKYGGKWTVLVYLCVSDMEDRSVPTGTTLLNNFCETVDPEKVNVAILTGGTKSPWKNNVIDPSKLQLYTVENKQLKLIEQSPLVSMGNPKTLSDFMIWGINNMPADNYMLILRNHGGGTSGVCFDTAFKEADNKADERLTLEEIRNALSTTYSSTKKKFELISMDACLMGDIETIATVQPYTNYLMGSVEITYTQGKKYYSMLNTIMNNKKATGVDVAKAFCDEYYNTSISTKVPKIAIQVWDMSKIPKVLTAFDNFIQKVNANGINSEKMLTIVNAAIKAKAYAGDTDPSAKSYFDLIDLPAFVKGMESLAPDMTGPLLASIKEAVVYNKAGPGYEENGGMSIYFPARTKNPANTIKKYNDQVPGFMNYKKFVTDINNLRNSTKVTLSEPETYIDQQNSNRFTLRVDPAQKKYICDLNFYFALSDGNAERFLVLGIDRPELKLNSKNEFYTEPYNAWLTVNGEFASAYVERVNGNIQLYSVPATLNGKYVFIKLMYDINKKSFEVLGAVSSDINEYADDNLISIKNGDKMTLNFMILNTKTNQNELVEGDPFIVDKSLKIAVEELPQGVYIGGFQLIDFGGNKTSSKAIAFKIN